MLDGRSPVRLALALMRVQILTSVFFCFALDRDAARTTREEVHVVLKEVPGVGTGPVSDGTKYMSGTQTDT